MLVVLAFPLGFQKEPTPYVDHTIRIGYARGNQTHTMIPTRCPCKIDMGIRADLHTANSKWYRLGMTWLSLSASLSDWLSSLFVSRVKYRCRSFLPSLVEAWNGSSCLPSSHPSVHRPRWIMDASKHSASSRRRHPRHPGGGGDGWVDFGSL